MDETKNAVPEAQTGTSTPSPEVPVVPTPSKPGVLTSIPNKKSSALSIVLVLLVILCLGAAGVFAYQNYILNKKLAQVNSTPLSTPSATTDPTANWRTYTDPVSAAYSFKYPNNYTLPGDKEVSISLPLTGNPNEVALAADGTTWKLGTDAPFDGFNVSIVTLGNLSFDNFVVNEVNAEKDSPRGIQSTQTYKMTVDGQPAVYIESEANIRRYFILNKDNKTAIVFSTATRAESFLKTMDQILSTFKFTVPHLSYSTTNWKTYTVSGRGISFKYPSEWKTYSDSGSVGYDDTGNGYFGISVGFDGNENNLSLTDFINNISSYAKTATKIAVNVGPKQCLQFNSQQNQVYYSHVYCKYDDKTILEIDASGNKSINQELLTNIFSTFKFTQ